MLRDTLRYVIGRAMERYFDVPYDLRKKAESNFEEITKPFSSELAERLKNSDEAKKCLTENLTSPLASSKLRRGS